MRKQLWCLSTTLYSQKAVLLSLFDARYEIVRGGGEEFVKLIQSSVGHSEKSCDDNQCFRHLDNSHLQLDNRLHIAHLDIPLPSPILSKHIFFLSLFKMKASIVNFCHPFLIG
ncbi:UNVERIFIED_CONTAM: hypothetical protein K2H54_057907 [Gekko kuhli]